MYLYREISNEEYHHKHYVIGYDVTPPYNNYEAATIQDIDKVRNFIMPEIVKDFYNIRQLIEFAAYFKGWGNLTNEEKQIVIDYNAHYNDTDKVVYLMSIGYSEVNAKSKLANAWLVNHGKTIKSLEQRFFYAKKVIMSRLTQQSITDFCFSEPTKTLKNLYMHDAVEGIGYGDFMPGLFNYIESTHDYTNNGMRENLTLSDENDNFDSFIADIMDILYLAKYDII